VIGGFALDDWEAGCVGVILLLALAGWGAWELLAWLWGLM
jgi:hypothetical protein